MPNSEVAPDLSKPQGDRLVTTREAAEIVGLSNAWFERKRVYGGGPPFVKLPGRGAVRYSESKLRAWFEALTRTSTSVDGLAS